MKILIGIPAHDEEKHIVSVVNASKIYGDVLVLNNGSTDNTEALALKAGAAVESYKWSGYGRALRTIFSWARAYNYDYLITLDGDGQHDPFEIPSFLSAITLSDVVIGNRFMSKDDKTPLHRKAVIYILNGALGLGDTQCGFRAYNRRAIEVMTIAEDGIGASIEIINRAFSAGLKISEVSCTIKYGKDNNPSKVLEQGMNLIETIFWSTIWARPYTFLGIPAVSAFLVAMSLGIYALNIYVAQHQLIQNLAIISGVLFLISLLLVIFIFFITIQRRVIKELSAK